MRVSSQSISTMMLRNLQLNSAKINKLSEQIYSQKRVSVPSDDPIASTRLVQLRREQAAISQYQSNITRLSGSLATQESHVTAFSNALMEMNDKLLSASNGSHAEADMEGFGWELDAMLESLVSGLNAKNEDGHYLFGGTKNNQQPVTYDPVTQTYSFQGNTSERETTVGNGVNIKENTDLSAIFSATGSDMDVLNKLQQLSEKMKDPTIPLVSYQNEFQGVLKSLQGAMDKNAGVLTGLGGRQNQLSMLNEAHEGVKIANDGVVRELSELDPAEAYVNLQLYMNSIQASNSSYMKITQLSLFNLV